MAHLIIAAINKTIDSRGAKTSADEPPSKPKGKEHGILEHGILGYNANFIAHNIEHGFFWSPVKGKFLKLEYGFFKRVIIWIQSFWTPEVIDTHTCATRTLGAIQSALAAEENPPDGQLKPKKDHSLVIQWKILTQNGERRDAPPHIQKAHLCGWKKLNKLLFPPHEAPSEEPQGSPNVKTLKISKLFSTTFSPVKAEPEDAAPPEDDGAGVGDGEEVTGPAAGGGAGDADAGPAAGVGAGDAGAGPAELEVQITEEDRATFEAKLGPELSQKQMKSLTGLVVAVLGKDTSFISSTWAQLRFVTGNPRRLACAHSIPPLRALTKLLSNPRIREAYQKGRTANKESIYFSYFKIACSFHFEHLPSTQGEFELFLNELNIPHDSRDLLWNTFNNLNKPFSESIKYDLWAHIIDSILIIDPTE